MLPIRLNPSTRKIQACNSNCAAGLIISPRIIIHIPNLVLVGVYLLKPTKRRTIKVCPRTVRMYANAQISGVFPDIVRTGSEVHFCRCPDTGLALASCQSGVWRTSGSSNGSYSNLGSHRGSFTGRNTGSGTLFVYASGGNGGSAGGDCANTSRLQGYVAGALISTNASNNPSYGKTAFISFAVPAGATYQITSYPAQNYSCGSGVFSVFGYQT